MLTKEFKTNLILLCFSALLHEVLTPVTLGLVILGVILVSLHFKTTKMFRNFLALAIFASYWFTYGKIIDPEVGLNFLTSIIVLKILEKESMRDNYMIFFGLLLLISAGSLFEKTLTYVFFFSLSFIVMVADFYSNIGQKFRVKDLFHIIFWVSPLTFLLFFFVPRLLNPIPFQQDSLGPGEIGYTPEVNISQIDSLSSNEKPVFQVMVSKPVGQNDLYWRGNTLSMSDGWNWNLNSSDRSTGEHLLGVKAEEFDLKQNFRMYGRSEFFFALDHPRLITYGKTFLNTGNTRTLIQNRWKWVQRYTAVGRIRAKFSNEEELRPYLRVPLPKKMKSWIKENFLGNTVDEIKAELKKRFVSENFTYSLSPGKSASFEDFFMNKKIGLCSHYASALALILRTKGIPARLVSGFMGGSFNSYADFYLITQNDAHVWVEAHQNDQWIRLDPTAWIAPDRVRLGGEAFMASVKSSGLLGLNTFFKAPKFFQDLKLWFGQWDFVFYQWLEQMDYHAQDAWLSKLKFERAWLFSLVPLILLCFMGFYIWVLSNKKRMNTESELKNMWKLFYQKMKKSGFNLSPVSIAESQRQLSQSGHVKKDLYLEIWQKLLLLSFSNSSQTIHDLKKQIKKL